MNINNLNTFTRGWLIGNFEPSLLKTNDFEIGIKKYKAGDKEPAHYHKVSTEYTVIIDGIVTINDITYHKDDIITIHPNEIVEFSCIEDTTTLVIKTPHTPNDKYLA